MLHILKFVGGTKVLLRIIELNKLGLSCAKLRASFAELCLADKLVEGRVLGLGKLSPTELRITI